MFLRILWALFILQSTFTAQSQGIKGIITDAKGQVLPFTSIYVEELKTGSSSNKEGFYELRLDPGSYTLRFQYIGYESASRSVTVVADTWLEMDISLAEQGLVLQEIIVTSSKEDAAYTIMRKAIAKADYHRMIYDSLTVMAYVKGTGILENMPFFLRKTLAEEGLKEDEAYTSESVSKITLKQPNEQIEEVLSIRSAGQGIDQASPTPFILTSFYERGDTFISPLDTRAFGYYRFEYLGSFEDGEYIVNKIKVTPRSRGEQVYEGVIYILEDVWAIHSLDLLGYYLGFKVRLEQNYADILPKVWLPVTQKITFSGSFLGFKGRFEYLVAMRDYDVHLNTTLQLLETEIIDEKIEEVPEEIQKISPRIIDGNLPENPDEMTRKQFRQMMNEFEKEQLRQQEEPQITSIRSTRIDSLARKKDSTYWERIRPIPLNNRELAGYQRDDSTAVVRQAELTGRDSLGVIPKRAFNFKDPLLGASYRLGPSARFFIDNTLLKTRYNTVEGFNANAGLGVVYNFDSLRRRITLRSDLRYGFSSRQFYGTGTIRYQHFGNRVRPSFRAEMQAGSFVEQLSTGFPSIDPVINSFSSLLYRQNFMKLYQKEFARVVFAWNKGSKWSLNSSFQFARRSPLFNTSDISLYNREDRVYTPNAPDNLHGATDFAMHDAFITELRASYRPFTRYYINNGRRYENFERSPELRLNYRTGIKGVLGSDVSFNHLELGIAHDFQLGIRGKFDFQVKAGTFFGNAPRFFMDFAHFEGNLTGISSIRPAGAYRLLDYYLYSTNGEYLSVLTHYQFRKFLFTRMPGLRISGLRENVFVNYLKTPVSPHYLELGYGIDNIFRLFRVEFATSFEDMEYRNFGYRIGVASLISIGGE
jgi:hypothetical protein